MHLGSFPRLAPPLTVRVVSPGYPAAAYAPSVFERGVSVLESRGHTVLVSETVYRATGYKAGSDTERALDLTNAMKHETADLVMCALGGYRGVDLLEHLNYAELRSSGSVLVGHSANVIIMAALLTQSGLGSFHGPSIVNQLGEYPRPFKETIARFETCLYSNGEWFDVTEVPTLTGEAPHWWNDQDHRSIRQRVPVPSRCWYKHGEAQGRFLGGHLLDLAECLDTPYFPIAEGDIMFWDTNIINAPHVDYLLREFYERGVLQNLAGMVISLPSQNRDPCNGPRYNDVIAFWADRVNGPVVGNIQAGHMDPSWTLPFGGEAQISSNANRISCRTASSD